MYRHKRSPGRDRQEGNVTCTKVICRYPFQTTIIDSYLEKCFDMDFNKFKFVHFFFLLLSSLLRFKPRHLSRLYKPPALADTLNNSTTKPPSMNETSKCLLELVRIDPKAWSGSTEAVKPQWSLCNFDNITIWQLNNHVSN